MTDGLKDAHREAIIAVIAANDRVERAVLFGSRATGTNTVTSDVDIALFGDRLTLTDRARLAAAVEEIPMAQSVDLLLYDSISDRTLRAHIRREGIEWYAQPRSTHVDPDNWPMVRLGDHAESCLGKMLDQHKNRGELLPYLANKNVRWGSFDTRELGRMRFEDHEHDRYGLKYGDLVVCEGGEPGRCAIWKNEVPGMKIQKALHRIRAGDQLDNRFLHYWFLLAGLNGALEPYFTGTTIKHLTGKAIAELQIPLPPLPEQRAIAHILGTLDDKIALNRRMNETLEAMARALFKSWFIAFDPVRANMEGQDTGLPPDIAVLFPDQLVDSEMGEIPEGWQQGTLNDLARLNPESWSSRNAPDRIRYVDLANTKWGSINDIQEFTWEDTPSRGRRVLRRGDTIVGTVRPRNGSFALIDRDGLTGSTAFAVLRPATPTERELVWCTATSEDAIQRLAHLADGGAYPAVRPKAVLDTTVALPAPPVRLAFSSLAAPLVSRMGATQRESRTLAALRDTLIPNLISGQIRVGECTNAEAILNEVG